MSRPQNHEGPFTSRRVDLEGGLIERSLHPDDIVDWYFSIDPLTDDYYTGLADIDTNIDDVAAYSIEYSLYQAGLHAAAATGLVFAESELSISDQQAPMHDSVEAALYLPKVGRLIEADPKNAKYLAVAQDCYFRASLHLRDVLRIHDASDGTDGDFRSGLHAAVQNYEDCSVEINQTIFKLTLARYVWTDNMGEMPSELHEALMYSTKQFASNIFYRSALEPNEARREFSRRSGFHNLVESIEDLILAPHIKSNKSVVKDATMKGDLHELLWLLDTNFMLSRCDTSGQSFAASSPIGYDQPIVGRPDEKRSYDVIGVSPSLKVPIQLKSGNYSASRHIYDSRIVKVTEENFQDVSIRRLDSRLRDYREWIEGRSTDEALAAKIESRVLPSAERFVDDFINSDTIVDPKTFQPVVYALGKRGAELLHDTFPINRFYN